MSGVPSSEERHVQWVARKLREFARRIEGVEAIAHSHRLEHVTSGAVAGTNWTLVSFEAWTSRSLCTFTIQLERTTSNLVSPDSVNEGVLINTVVAVLPPSCRGDIAMPQNVTTGMIGRGLFGSYFASNGNLYLTASTSGDDILVGEEITLGGVVILNA